MKFLFASDSFKGTLSSRQTARLLTQAAREIFPDCECDSIGVADGGEGTTDAVVAAAGGSRIEANVHGPLWEKRTASYGKLEENRAVMEMAAASGLPFVPEEQRDPRKTTSYGTGEMIRDALDKGFRDISIAIGGSATNDGGMGCIRALGVRFLDENAEELSGCGKDLIRVRKIDMSGMDPRVKDCKFTVMCDVTNPLCGEQGGNIYLWQTERRHAGDFKSTGSRNVQLPGYPETAVRRGYGYCCGSRSGRRTGRSAHGILRRRFEVRDRDCSGSGWI